MIELMLQAERALSMGLVDSAEHLYWQAVESDGRNVIAIVGLAKVALARGDDRTALQFARKALELDPEDGAARRLVERLEDLARLRTGSGTENVSAPAEGDAGAVAAAPTSGADDPSGGVGADGPQPPVAAGTAAPASKPSKADIEWPATDVLGAAPSARPRPPVPTRAPGTVPPEPAWPAIPPAKPPAEPADAAPPVPPTPSPAAAAPPTPPPATPAPAAAPTPPASAPMTPAPAATPPETEKKRGLMNRFRRNG